MTKDIKKSVKLNALMLKEEFYNDDFINHLTPDIELVSYELQKEHQINGLLYIKKQTENTPNWLSNLQNISEKKIDELKNTSSSAVLFIKTPEEVFAFTFGYGKFMINEARFVQDFGIITALNTLNHESLRSIDLHSFGDQPIQKREQVTKALNINTFGIDISKDILKSVTGIPREGISFRNISGGGVSFVFSHYMIMEEIKDICLLLKQYYKLSNYKTSFSWVDNIRIVKIKDTIDKLNKKLVASLSSKSNSVTVHVPEVIDWNDVIGFSFTRSKKNIQTTLDISNYYKNNPSNYSEKTMNNDYLFVYLTNNLTKQYSLYKSLYYEVKLNQKTYILFSSNWYEIDNSFMNRIKDELNQIPLSSISFPDIEEVKVYNKKKKKYELKLEREDDYNIRTAKLKKYGLMDKKLVKSDRTTTAIEVCDLITTSKQLIHVKHRKGGSAGLSHLFAQGHVSAETLLGDKNFRKETRKVLKKIKQNTNLIPLNSFQSSNYEIIFLILGIGKNELKDKLPFFSKVNLTKTYENLTQKGFDVTINSVPIKSYK